jgi:hypothetical protein
MVSNPRELVVGLATFALFTFCATAAWHAQYRAIETKAGRHRDSSQQAREHPATFRKNNRHIEELHAEARTEAYRAEQMEGMLSRERRSLMKSATQAVSVVSSEDKRGWPTAVEMAEADFRRPAASCENGQEAKIVIFDCSDVPRAHLLSELGTLLASSVGLVCGSERVDNTLFELSLDCRFRRSYENIFAKGWVENAFVVPLNRKAYVKGAKFMGAIELLVESAHTYSNEPILLFAPESTIDYEELGALIPASKWPQLVVFWIPSSFGFAQWSFTKLRSMILSFALTTIQLDVGILVGPLIDRLFERAKVHTNERYPYPIFPTRNLGHQTPTCTFYALPFLGHAYLTALTHPARGTGHNMGSDWISVHSLAHKLTKEWCKWDVGPLASVNVVGFDYDLDRAQDFAYWGEQQPVIVGYASRCPEISLDRVSISEVWDRSAGVNVTDAAQHWLAYKGQWYPKIADAEALLLSCVL